MCNLILNDEDLKKNEIKIKNNKTKEEVTLGIDYLLYYLDEVLLEDEIENMEGIDMEKRCTCGDECDCTIEENCGCLAHHNCDCGDDCHCTKEDNCGCMDDCDCDDECSCGHHEHECHCHHKEEE